MPDSPASSVLELQPCTSVSGVCSRTADQTPALCVLPQTLYTLSYMLSPEVTFQSLSLVSLFPDVKELETDINM